MRNTAENLVPLNTKSAKVLEVFRAARKEKRAEMRAKKRLVPLISYLQNHMGEKEILLNDDMDDWLAKWPHWEYEKDELDEDMLREKYPEIAAECTKTKTVQHRRFTLNIGEV